MALSIVLTAALVIVWIFFANAIARRLNQRWEVFGEVAAFILFLIGTVGILVMVS